MNSTKEKILKTALQLFNQNGVSKVSLRQIADTATISVGNLQYHFKKREDIIEALYYQLVEKIDAIIIIPKKSLLHSFFIISTELFTQLYDYQFFLIDFVTITRQNKNLKKHYAQLSKKRELEFLHIVTILIENKLFNEAELKNEYQNLYKRTEVISNFWFSSSLIQSKKTTKKAIGEYSLIIRQSIYPYLTVKAKEEYHNLYSE